MAFLSGNDKFSAFTGVGVTAAAAAAADACSHWNDKIFSLKRFPLPPPTHCRAHPSLTRKLRICMLKRRKLKTRSTFPSRNFFSPTRSLRSAYMYIIWNVISLENWNEFRINWKRTAAACSQFILICGNLGNLEIRVCDSFWKGGIKSDFLCFRALSLIVWLREKNCYASEYRDELNWRCCESSFLPCERVWLRKLNKSINVLCWSNYWFL